MDPRPETETPTPPMGSETKFAQKVGEAVARQMARANPKARHIPPHRWSQKLARLGQRLVCVGLAVVAIKLAWPTYVQIGAVLVAFRALSPDLADGTIKWALSIVKLGKSVKDGP